MKRTNRIAIVALLAAAAAATLALRKDRHPGDVAAPAQPAAVAPAGSAAAPRAADAPAPVARPRLLEFGSSRCMACAEMAKVLDALRASQGERLQVDFVDIYEQPALAEDHKVLMIPTQILFDAAGREIFRHTGYFAHDDILAKFRESGVKL